MRPYLIPSFRTFGLLILMSLFFLHACKTGTENKKTGSSVPGLPPANDEFYQEIANEAGIDFSQSIGSEHLTNIIESSGGGAAMLDFDKDGYQDLLVTSGTWIEGFSSGEKPENLPGNRLYRNMQNGTFTDVTEKAHITDLAYTMGATIGDFNNDGFPDIYLSNYGPNILYKNNGNGTFSNVTKKAGVAGGKECSVGAAWLDYDNDGFLDLYVGNYLTFDPNYKYFYAPDGFPGPLAYDAEKDFLFRNLGDGTFKEVSAEIGILDLDGRAMGVGAIDFDEDGWIDIYVANDKAMNYLWHNEQGKGFKDVGVMSGTAFGQGGEAVVSMSVDFADYNSDGLIDVFLSDDNYCSLFENNGNGTFTDKANISGISTAAATFVGWNSSFIDFDNDGDVDIFKTNGALKHLYGQEDQLFENLGDGSFIERSATLGSYFHEELVGRGAALGDYDNDGDIDIYIANLNHNGIFLRNNKGNLNNWIILDLEGTKSNRDGIGTIAKIYFAGKVHAAQKKSTTGYLSQNDNRLHFGLGKAEAIEKITLRWPSGKEQQLENIKANQILKITEPN